MQTNKKEYEWGEGVYKTNLQYDLACWVHSHPGLGVFFSNSDANVQMQLKHSTHPNFLTAIVVDILTPNQELGIFTFKPDSTISGLFSQLFHYSTPAASKQKTFETKYAYCTAGTNVLSAADWFSNIAQGLIGWAPQYVQSVRNAKILDKSLKDYPLIFIQGQCLIRADQCQRQGCRRIQQG